MKYLQNNCIHSYLSQLIKERKKKKKMLNMYQNLPLTKTGSPAKYLNGKSLVIYISVLLQQLNW